MRPDGGPLPERLGSAAAAVASIRPDPVLSVRDLDVTFRTRRGEITPVAGVSFDLHPGEVLAIVGESGSGKTVTALSLVRLVHGAEADLTGTAMYRGRNLLTLTEREMRRVRGAEISMIFQDPMTSLNPLARVGDQIVEMLELHTKLRGKKAWVRAIALLEEVGIARARERARSYPHEFSGGMRQRVMIALATACNPSVLIADEPTTALDVTIQAQIIDLIRRQAESHGTATILITHDLGVVAEVADRVAVMYAGRIVETGSCETVFAEPQHPYTWGLLSCVPRPDRVPGSHLTTIEGTPPSPYAFPDGCRFRTRCKHAFEKCLELPDLRASTSDPGHAAACWLTDRRQHSLPAPTLDADTRQGDRRR